MITIKLRVLVCEPPICNYTKYYIPHSKYWSIISRTRCKMEEDYSCISLGFKYILIPDQTIIFKDGKNKDNTYEKST